MACLLECNSVANILADMYRVREGTSRLISIFSEKGGWEGSFERLVSTKLNGAKY